MGKVRVKTFGSPEEEEQQKRQAKQKKEAKKLTKAPGLKGGERVVAVGPSEEEIAKEVEEKKKEEVVSHSAEASRGKKEKFVKRKIRSRRYQESIIELDKSKTYPLGEALEILSKFQKAKFDETVELHLNTTRGGISGNMTLPHGTGKITRVAVADDPSASSGQAKLETLIKKIESGNVDFDILVAHPSAMSQLAKVAKVLGPRGLMPNPKNGTITQNPQDVVKKFEGGQISFKTEAKAPLIHMTVGKFSFGEKKLTDNIKTAVGAIKAENIQAITLKSSMSPGIKVQV